MKENKDIIKNSVKNRTKKKHKLLTEIRFSMGVKELCSDTINISNVENDENGKSNDNQIDKNENHENNYNVNHDNNVRKGLYDENNNTKKIHECHTDENENKTEKLQSTNGTLPSHTYTQISIQTTIKLTFSSLTQHDVI